MGREVSFKIIGGPSDAELGELVGTERTVLFKLHARGASPGEIPVILTYATKRGKIWTGKGYSTKFGAYLVIITSYNASLGKGSLVLESFPTLDDVLEQL